MIQSIHQCLRDCCTFFAIVFRTAAGITATKREPVRIWLTGALFTGYLAWTLVILFVPRSSFSYQAAKSGNDRPTPGHHIAAIDYSQPVREEPRRFLANTYRPKKREGVASGSINPKTFFPKYDLIRIDDPRVWWESEHDKGDTEDDHVMHRAMREPVLRLIELVHQHGGTLKVQDAYRATGVHAPRSLHREGRAIDVTCDELGLEKLAKLCWAAGFDWVYFEAPKRGGAHIHASVRAQRPANTAVADSR
jgi:hypothetical protein